MSQVSCQLLYPAANFTTETQRSRRKEMFQEDIPDRLPAPPPARALRCQRITPVHHLEAIRPLARAVLE